MAAKFPRETGEEWTIGNLEAGNPEVKSLELSLRVFENALPPYIFLCLFIEREGKLLKARAGRVPKKCNLHNYLDSCSPKITI